MNIENWKKLTNTDRQSILSNPESFDPYSNNSYELVRDLGEELALSLRLPQGKVGVLNRFGELIIHLHAPEERLSLLSRDSAQVYYGFSVIYSDISAWFKH